MLAMRPDPKIDAAYLRQAALYLVDGLPVPPRYWRTLGELALEALERRERQPRLRVLEGGAGPAWSNELGG
jgi:hypothetical protein